MPSAYVNHKEFLEKKPKKYQPLSYNNPKWSISSNYNIDVGFGIIFITCHTNTLTA